MTDPIGIVVTVFRGGCEVVHDDRLLELRLLGRHARREIQLAVGDEVSFDPERAIVLDLLERRTLLQRLRPQGGRRRHDPGKRKVIAANMDRLAIVTSLADPPFRSGVVDRFLLAGVAGGMQTILIVNKLDLVADGALPPQILAYRTVLPVLAVSATERIGLDALRRSLAESRTVLAGHSGVGKSSLINALDPELRLETAEVREKSRKGRHTTSRAIWIRLAGGAIVVDTPGVREIATGPVDPTLLDHVYPDVVGRSRDCRFRDCAHGFEPGCGVRAAIDRGDLLPERLDAYRRLLDDVDASRHTSE